MVGRNFQGGVGVQYAIIVRDIGFTPLQTTLLSLPNGFIVRALLMLWTTPLSYTGCLNHHGRRCSPQALSRTSFVYNVFFKWSLIDYIRRMAAL